MRIRFHEPADEAFQPASDISSGLMSRGRAFRRRDENSFTSLLPLAVQGYFRFEDSEADLPHGIFEWVKK